jgi:NAD(P)-dependent dehydrogenase (short-subunit alcohol dehydrogenase family)
LTREPPAAALDVSAGPEHGALLAARRAEPRSLLFEEMADVAGALDYAAPELAAAFPHAAGAIGRSVLEGLAASTYVVGMELPGLHSIFSRLTAALDPSAAGGRVAFRALSVDPRFRLVDLVVRSPAVAARFGAFVRVPPVEPPSMSDIRARVSPGEFSGQRAFVVGGSRGLGATTAKLLAAGGAEVLVTYARGATEAARVRDDITAAGGRCTAMPYDALAAPAPQLAATAFAPNALYYFATGTIWRRKARAFEPAVFRDLARLHVEGFAELVEAVRARTSGRLAVFYPSSVYAAKAPGALGEYAAVKRAAEAVAENLGAILTDVSMVMERLPAVDTDQNASVTGGATVSPVDAMTPLVRRMQAAL